jgi:hypothetical protein
MNLRTSFRFAGMWSELEFLARERFTGEVKYWRDGSELRREMKNISTGEPPVPETDPLVRLKVFRERVESWCGAGELPLVFFFRCGNVKRIEE